MTLQVQSSAPQIAEQMSVVMDRADLPQKARLAGLHLLRRLSSPVRITVFGTLGVGKSTIINVLCGKVIVPAEVVRCPISLTFGQTARTIAVGSDGDRIEINGIDVAAAAKLAPALINIEAPIAYLQDVSLLEMAIDPAGNDVAAAMQWALARTDICLWCTKDFGDDDKVLWHHMPDAMKDHAYLVLTKVDQLSAPNALKDHIRSLAPVINSEFHSVLPVAGRAALSALDLRDDEFDVSRWMGSGADALTKAIRQHATRGRREDLDNAELFLARYAKTVGQYEPPVQPAAPAPAAEALVPPTPDARLDATPAAPIMDSPSPKTTRPDPLAKELWLNAAQTLCDSAKPLSAHAPSGVMDQCLATLEQLSDFAEDHSNAMGDDVVDNLFEATEIITLLQLEGDDGSASDAIAVLAQLKFEFELRAAA